MNKSQLKRRLKNESGTGTPDVYDKIVVAAEAEGLLNIEESEFEANGGSTLRAKNKNKLTAAVASVCAIFLAGIIAVVSVIVIKSPFSRASTPFNITLTSENAYGLGAVSTVKLLGGNVSVKSFAKLSAVRAVAAADEENGDIKNQVEKFNEYFTALDSFLNDGLVDTKTENNPDADMPYKTKMTITGTELDGRKVEYIMYYNEELKSYESSSDKDETEYTLEGIMLSDGVEYYLTGEREAEIEHDETEHKLKIRAYADKYDKGTYVEMEQEQSEETNEKEIEYVYSVYKNGILTERTAVEFETEIKNGKEETEYELEFRTGSSRGSYKVERDIKDGSPCIKVAYNLDGKKGKFTITPTYDGKYEYKFSDGTTKTLNG